MEHVDVTIIGAGAVGLALAARLSSPKTSVLVLEKNDSFGQETSSRNSEVIHAGIYYTPGSLKAKLCVQGNPLLYDYCRREGVNHKRIGKVIVATDEGELANLTELFETGSKNGVPGLKLLDRAQVKALEPAVTALGGLLSPSTGILDTHGFMRRLARQAQAQGAMLACGAEVTAIEMISNGFRVTAGSERFETTVLINSAGLYSDKVAEMAGIDRDKAGYRLHFCKGDYFRTKLPLRFTGLVYPVPQKHGLGVHVTQDLAGGVRFGPDTAYVTELDYRVDAEKRFQFCRAARAYLPDLRPDDLYPDTSGIRPKLQGEHDGFRDFVIRHEKDRGLHGLVNLVGIESPGLTSSLALAEYVETILKSDGLLS